MSRLGGEKEEDVGSLKKVVIRTYVPSLPLFFLWYNPPSSPRHIMHPLRVYYYSLLAAGNGGEEYIGWCMVRGDEPRFAQAIKKLLLQITDKFAQIPFPILLHLGSRSFFEFNARNVRSR